MLNEDTKYTKCVLLASAVTGSPLNRFSNYKANLFKICFLQRFLTFFNVIPFFGRLLPNLLPIYKTVINFEEIK